MFSMNSEQSQKQQSNYSKDKIITLDQIDQEMKNENSCLQQKEELKNKSSQNSIKFHIGSSDENINDRSENNSKECSDLNSNSDFKSEDSSPSSEEEKKGNQK